MEPWTIWTIGGADRIGASASLNYVYGKYILIDSGNDVPDGLNSEDLIKMPEVNVREKLRDKHIDLALITHGHNDHVGKLIEVWQDHPEMRVMMTRPTLETARIILEDGIRIKYKDQYGRIKEEDREAMFEEIQKVDDLLLGVEIIEHPGFYTPFDRAPIRIGFFPADHIRGAMTVLIKTTENGKEKSVLFTGDFGLENKETVLAAPIRDEYRNVDLVLCDSTNGSTILPPREERYRQLVAIVGQTLARQGNVLLPGFGIERSQEVLIHLIKNGFRTYLDGMGNKFLELYRSPEGQWCDQDRMFYFKNPIWRNFVPVTGYNRRLRKTGREIILGSKKPWVVVATSATLKGGSSPEYAMRILEDEKSTIIFTSHLFEGTPAHDLYHKRGEEITLVTQLYPEGKPVIPRCQIEQIRLSAHMDQNVIARFIKTIRPKQLAPVHCGGADSHDALEERLRKNFSLIRTQNGMTIEL